MNQYELILLLDEEKQVDEFKKLIEGLKAKVVSEEKWGKKNLAYRIKKKTSAFYSHFVIELDQKNAQDLRKKLDYDETLLRYLLLKI